VSEAASTDRQSATVAALGRGQRRPVRPGEVRHLRRVDDPALSPDGRRVAFVLLEAVPGEVRLRRRIWLCETAGDQEPVPLGQVVQGIHLQLEQSCPRWSPDGRLLAFLARPLGGEGRAQIYLAEADGGEVRQLTTLPGGASELQWAPDSKRLACLSPDGEEPARDPRVAGAERYTRLWSIHIDEGLPRPVTPDNVSVWEYCWSPDGRRFALYYSDEPELTAWYRGQIGLVDAAGGAVRRLTQLQHQASALTWSPDSRRIAYVSGEWSDVIHGSGDLYVLALDGGEPRNLTPGIDCSPAWCCWFPDGRRLLYTAWSGLTQQIAILDEISGERVIVEADCVMHTAWPRLAISSDLRRFVVQRSSQVHPSDLYFGELRDEKKARPSVHWRRLTRLNPLAEETWLLPSSERISYESVDGWRIEALFTPPAVPRGTGAPPLVVYVHGGPTWAFLDDFAWEWSLALSTAGYALLRPNIRGSVGRGVAFADAVVGDMGGKDFQDILAGVDALIARGLVDGERLAIVGWSYGGFLAAWAITQTTRFKAAVVGAGLTDWHGFHAQSNIPDFDLRFLQADPLEQPEVYRERSPITYAARITTPTLILHGEEDECVPLNQAWALYRALRRRRVPVELVTYPRENHVLLELPHQRDCEERLLRWLDRYLW
jgi:dipeptidyl aminopeptidase/acylaminoacyl peptidase